MLTFPITKSQLHNGFLIKKNISEIEKTKLLENYIKDEIKLISHKIIASTINEKIHSRLCNNLMTKIIPKVNTEKKCIETIKVICERSQEETSTIKDTVRKEQILTYYFTLSINELNKKLNNNIKHINYISNSINESDLINSKMQILEGLRNNFPDTLIEIDDKHTHLTIDWN
jgi:hypothetical protein